MDRSSKSARPWFTKLVLVEAMYTVSGEVKGYW